VPPSVANRTSLHALLVSLLGLKKKHLADPSLCDCKAMTLFL
jgi:hypothetical protein